jgi:RNA polymerase sigma factor (sigma-70 family)
MDKDNLLNEGDQLDSGVPYIDDLETIDLDVSYEPVSTEYSSPLLSRVVSNKLTVELLEIHIPILREGEKADEALRTKQGKLSEKQVRELRRLVKEGARSKEILFNSALPLIRTISQKEYRRRSQWGSAIPLDDLMQDAIVGFFKGLRIFELTAARKSATNYLGQWMLSEMRRAAESMDNDLQVGHDAGERFRKIRAIRSRLYNDLNREPTDEEIVDASNNADYTLKPGLVGRVNPKGGSKPKGVTLEQVKEEKEMRSRMGSAIRIGSGGEEESGSGDQNEITLDRTSGGEQNLDENEPNDLSDPALVFESQAGSRMISSLVEKLLINLELPEQQSEIISRKFGLAPYEKEASAREISRIMGIHREKIARVLNSFQAEILTPGGALHRIIKDVDYEDMMNLGLGWLADSLGEWKKEYELLELDTSEELTRPISLSSDRKLKEMRAYYLCDYEDNIFEIRLNKGSSPLNIIDCPVCGKPAALNRFTEKLD